jgi:ABC-type transport system involved in cytochrome bd biosynthesis fused ATPase/permease subunit
VITGLLADKTVLFATHALQHLQPHHACLYIESGQVHLSTWGVISSEHAAAFSVSDHRSDLTPNSPALRAAPSADDSASAAPAAATRKPAETISSVNAAAGGSGAVTLETYWNYFDAAPGRAMAVFACVVVFVVGQVIRVGADYWIALWSGDLLNQSQRWYLGGYWIFVFVLIPFVFCRSWLFFYTLLQASRRLHDNLFHAVVNGVTSFFDVVPCGHVISRLSSDIDVLDDQLPEFMEQTISLWLLIVAIVVVIAAQFPWFLLPVAALIALFLYVNEYFRRSSREMQVLPHHPV